MKWNTLSPRVRCIQDFPFRYRIALNAPALAGEISREEYWGIAREGYRGISSSPPTPPSSPTTSSPTTTSSSSTTPSPKGGRILHGHAWRFIGSKRRRHSGYDWGITVQGSQPCPKLWERTLVPPKWQVLILKTCNGRNYLRLFWVRPEGWASLICCSQTIIP